MYQLVFLTSAQKELQKLDRVTQKLIKQKLITLATNPEVLKNNIKALKGEHKGKYRLRVNNYRIIYSIGDEKLIITIIRITHRKEAY